MRTRLSLGLLTLALGACSSGPDDSGSLGGEIQGTAGGSSLAGSAGRPGIHLGSSGHGGGSNSTAGAPPVNKEDACASDAATAEPLPSVMQMVVDISGSMNWAVGEDRSPAAGEKSKWEITRDALLEAVADLGDTTAIGVNFYPNTRRSSDSCIRNRVDVPLALLGSANSNQRSQFESAMQAVEPRSGTPTHAAFRFGAQTLGQSELEGNQFVLLITDGTPTYTVSCGGNGRDPVDSGPLIAEAAAVFAADAVRTFVIGSPGSEGAREELSRVASAGGTAPSGCSDTGPVYCHFDMTREPDLAQALRGALAEIAGQIVSCEYEIPEPPSGKTLDPALVNVIYTPEGGTAETLLRDPSSACSDGWQYSQDGQTVVLCGATCDRIKSERGATVELLFGCKTEVGVPK